MLTQEQFVEALPAQVRKAVNTEIIDSINNIVEDEVFRDEYRENLISFSTVMQNGRFKLQSYVDAVRYISHKIRGKTDNDSYKCTFPERYAVWVKNGTPQKDISSAISSYNKNKLVNLVWEQALIPAHIYNADIFQEALNTQAELMQNAKSEKVRCDAANSILTHLKRPEVQKIELDVGIKEDSSIKALHDSTMALVAQQKLAMQSGQQTPGDIAKQGLVIEHEEIL